LFVFVCLMVGGGEFGWRGGVVGARRVGGGVL